MTTWAYLVNVTKAYECRCSSKVGISNPSEIHKVMNSSARQNHVPRACCTTLHRVIPTVRTVLPETVPDTH
jgi:hypothetical protein